MKNTPEHRSTIQQIRQHARQMVRELDVLKNVYLDTGYTFTQCHVLFELSQCKSLNLVDLADRLLIDKSNTSRTVKKLLEQGLVKTERVQTDQRQKRFSLTAEGKRVLRSATQLADHQVADALANLNLQQQEAVVAGLGLYATALRKSRLQTEFRIRPIRKKDNAQVADIIRGVMTEFAAVGDGYSIDDPEVDDMAGNYRQRNSLYLVITRGDKIFGSGGLAPLSGGATDTCELRKMFFRVEIRGLGLGQRLLLQLLEEARQRGYRKCYLETLDRMSQANALYQKNGFQPLDKPKGCTGHTSCDRWYQLEL